MTLLEASPTTLATPVSTPADLPADHAGARHLRRGDLTKLALGAVGVVTDAVPEVPARPGGSL
jgi:hypothetical protein